MMRFGPKNWLECTTTTTGTGSYVLGPETPGHASLLSLADGTKLPCSVKYGSNREAGTYTKQGSLLLRSNILESTNGGGAVNWPAGTKTITCDWLAQNVAKSSDASITIEDDATDGKTNFRGLKISDVISWFQGVLREGVDVEITNVGGVITFNLLRKIVEDADADTIAMSMAASEGSAHIATVAGNRQLQFEDAEVGQEFTIKLDYDAIGNRKPLWPDQEANPTAVIEWVNGYRPEFTPVGSGSDTFRFLRIGTQSGLPKYLGWILSTERPVIKAVHALERPVAQFETLTQGVSPAAYEEQWLTATIDSDYMDYSLLRTGTVSGGTFDLQIQAGEEEGQFVTDIPFDVTAYELLTLIWENTDLDETQINVDGGVNGSDSEAKLTDPSGLIHVEFLGASRYTGYVISIDSLNLTGGGTYEVDATDESSGSQSWPFGPGATYDDEQTMRFVFNGNQTTDIAVGSGTDVIESALEQLPGIGEGNVRVARFSVGSYHFRFVGDLAGEDVSHEIQFAAGALPASDQGAATGQLFSTARNGAGPAGQNEIQQLSLTNQPIDGSVTISVLGTELTVSIFVTAQQLLYALAYAVPQIRIPAPGEPSNITVTGGPLLESPVTITFIDDLGEMSLPDSVVISTDVPEHTTIDWSICEAVSVVLLSRTTTPATYTLTHEHAIPGKTLHATLTSIGSEFDVAVEYLTYRFPAIAYEQSSIPSVNESFRLSAAPGEEGQYVVFLFGRSIALTTDMSTSEIESAIEAEIGDGVTVSGGPFPVNPITIALVGEYSGSQLSTINAATSTTPAQDAFRFLPPVLVLFPATGTLDWDGVPVDWNDSPPNVPANGESVYLEFYAESITRLLGKIWFSGALLSGLNFQGTWNAATNSPALVSGAATPGHYYIVATPGSTLLDGWNDWKQRDWVVGSSTGVWQQIDNSDLVTSVFGQVGNVLENQFRLNTLTEDLTPNPATDYVMTWDESAGIVKKVLLDNLPGSYTDDDVIDLLAEVLKDGYRIRWDVEVDSLGTHFYPDVVMENQAETYASSITIDLARNRGDRHTFTLTGNPTITVTSFSLDTDPERPGKLFRLVPTQDAIGGRTIDWTGSPQTWVFPDGEPALCVIPGASDELEFLVTDVESPRFVFVRAIHRPRRADDYCEPATTAAIATTQAGAGSLNGSLYELWKLEEATGSNRTGEILSVDLVEIGSDVDQTAGIDGNAINLSSGHELETDYNTLGTPPNSNVSLTFWLYPRAADDNVRFQIKNSAVNARLMIQQVDAGGGTSKANAVVMVWTGSIGESNNVTSTGTLTLNSWNLLSVKLTASNVYVSLNGAAFESTARTHFGTLFGTTPAARIDTQGLAPADADIDEPAIWSAALSDAEIADIWAAGAGIFYPFAGGTNEKHSLTFTGTPTKGSVIITFFPGDPDEADVTLPYNASAATAETLVNAVLGAGSVDVTGGPLPGTPLVIEYVGDYAATDVTEATVDDTSINGHARLDWLREVNYMLLKPGTYAPTIDLGDVLPSQTIRVAMETDTVTGSPSLVGTDFGDEGAPTLPGDGQFDLFELTAIDINTITGRTLQTGLTP